MPCQLSRRKECKLFFTRYARSEKEKQAFFSAVGRKTVPFPMGRATGEGRVANMFFLDQQKKKKRRLR